MTDWNVTRCSTFPVPASRRLTRNCLVALFAIGLLSCGKDDESKSAEGRPRTHAYVYNHPVSFRYGGEGERFQIEGWCGIEPDFTWTDGPIASLGFRLLQSQTPVLLRVTMSGNISPPQLPSQPVEVVIVETFAKPPHQKTIARWEVADEKVFTATIPHEFVAGPETVTRLEFHIPKAISPADLGRGRDTRRLGLRIAELTFEKTQEPRGKTKASDNKRRPFDYEYGEIVSFSSRGDAERFQVKGWSGRERDYTWTEGTSAMIGLRLHESKLPVTLSVRAAGMNHPPQVPFQPVDVMINGEKSAHWDVGEEATFTAPIPAKFTLVPENILLVELQLPGAVSPATFGQSGDGRRLGLRVRELSVAQTADSPTP